MDTFSMRSVPMLSCSCVIMSGEAVGIYLLSIQNNHNNPRAGEACQAARIGREDLLVICLSHHAGVAELGRAPFAMLQATYGWEAGVIVSVCLLFATKPSGQPRPRLPLRVRFSILTIALSIRSCSPRNSANIFSTSIRQPPFRLKARCGLLSAERLSAAGRCSVGLPVGRDSNTRVNYITKVTLKDRWVLNRFGAHGDNGAHPVGQTGDRQRISGKLRRKSMSGPSLRRIPGQLSPKTVKHPR